MRHTVFALFFGSFLAVCLPAADQQLVNMVMPEAKIVAGINVDSARNSPFGSFIIAQLPASDPSFHKFVEATGFNPSADLNEVLAATVGDTAAPAADAAALTAQGKTAPPSAHMGLIMARGNFHVEKIAAFAKSDGHQTVQTYNGAMLISDPKNSSSSAMAFIGSNIMIAGDPQSVKAAINRRTQANTLDPQLTAKVNSLSASQDAWAVSIAPLSSLNAGAATDPTLQGALAGDLFKKITTTSGGLKFGSQIQLTTELVAMDEKNATALGDVVKFLAGMATMNAGPAKGAPSILTTILQSLNVQTQGNVVNVTLSAPEDQLEGLFNSMQTGAKI